MWSQGLLLVEQIGNYRGIHLKRQRKAPLTGNIGSQGGGKEGSEKLLGQAIQNIANVLIVIFRCQLKKLPAEVHGRNPFCG